MPARPMRGRRRIRTAKAAALLAATLMTVATASAEKPAPGCRTIPEVAAVVQALNAFWSRATRLCQSFDPGESAVALPERDVVEANRQFLAGIARDYGAPAAIGILAHEWGHMVQGQVPGRSAELHADCLAGAFMRRRGYGKQALLRFALVSLDSGDDGLLIGNHGTGDQRQAAVLKGYEGAARRPVRSLLTYCLP